MFCYQAKARDIGKEDIPSSGMQSSIPTHTPQRQETMNMSFNIPDQMHHLKPSRSCQDHLLSPSPTEVSMVNQTEAIGNGCGDAEVRLLVFSYLLILRRMTEITQ